MSNLIHRLTGQPERRRQFMTAAGLSVDLDALLAEQQRWKGDLEAELERTGATLCTVEDQLASLPMGEPHRYVTGHHEQVDLDDLVVTLRRRRTQLRAELENLDRQLDETHRRIEAFDRG